MEAFTSPPGTPPSTPTVAVALRTHTTCRAQVEPPSWWYRMEEGVASRVWRSSLALRELHEGSVVARERTIGLRTQGKLARRDIMGSVLDGLQNIRIYRLKRGGWTLRGCRSNMVEFMRPDILGHVVQSPLPRHARAQ
jgi:hypothetical protein